jgi:hypothetical protein
MGLGDKMSKRYVPKIKEAAIPEDGGWVEGQAGPVLLLSIPEWDIEKIYKTPVQAYVWMYDRQQNAYLFCFRLQTGEEKAIAFLSDHAGLLLKETHANSSFSLMITSESLQEAEQALLIEEVELRRHPVAGW